MKNFLNRLSRLERGFLLGVVIAVYIVLNIVFVPSILNDWHSIKNRLETAHQTQAMFDVEIAKTPEYDRQIAQLEKAGATVQQEDQSSDFMRSIQSQAALSQVALLSTTPQQNQHTNQFFLEKIMAITVQTGDKQLVDFVYNLGAGNSMIRVRDLSLRPDGTRQQLAGTMRLVASYQKKAPTRPGVPAHNLAASSPAAQNGTSNTKRP